MFVFIGYFRLHKWKVAFLYNYALKMWLNRFSSTHLMFQVTARGGGGAGVIAKFK